MKNNRTKKPLKRLLCTAVITEVMLLMGGCGEGAEGLGDAASYETKKDDLKQAGLGAMALLYDETVWTYDEEQASDASIVFRDRKESVLGISCSKESYYQHPLDMANTAKQIY